MLMHRFMRDNVLLAGLWFSKDKPLMNLFFSPVIKEIYITCVKKVCNSVQYPWAGVKPGLCTFGLDWTMDWTLD